MRVARTLRGVPLPSVASARTLVALGSSLYLASACGGGESSVRAPRSPSAAAAAPAAKRAGPSRDEDENESEAPAPKAACSDETCFSCGSGFCPNGWFCDESASGGAGCSWVPECGKGGCACLEKSLGRGCSCSESDGGPHVSCK